MNYMKKLSIIKNACEDINKRIELFVNLSESHFTLSFINYLKNSFPYLPQSYIDFISQYDGLGLGWVTFFGSEHSDLPPITEALEMWSEERNIFELNDANDYLPFAKKSSGDLICFNNASEIVLFDHLYPENEPKLIAHNFDEFMNDCVLGKRYKEFDPIDDDPFYDYLKEQGWA